MTSYPLNNDGMFEDPKAMEGVRQGCKDPLPVTVASPSGNDEQCEQGGQNIQHISRSTSDLLPLIPFGQTSTIQDETQRSQDIPYIRE